MAVFNGKNLKIEIYGESHADKIGANVKGFPNFTFNLDRLNEFLSRRKASKSVFSTSRKEDDIPVFTNVENYTISGDFSVDIYNNNTKSGDYDNLYAKPRPSHADYSAFLKDGTLNFKGGGRFSGRLTAPLCIVGGLCKQYLESIGIFVEAYVSRIGNVCGKSYKNESICLDSLIKLRENEFPSLSNKEEMLNLISQAKKDSDSVGGVIECIVYNMKGGVGDNLFEGLEGKISSLVYSVPAVKGVEFGLGFDISKMFGSQANDQLSYIDNKVEFLTNNCGGINGGISNGAQITLSVAVKPTPSIYKKQKTIDIINKCNTEIEIVGRHDSCIVPRAVPCVESAVAIALLDEIMW